ncbi:MAG: HPr kinase/phosphatase C-terminal domain-containing protein [Alphaproteobacteria bacterium]|nr:HPr kinase/phosphatase C-terminal domain-containing protein [Alphaproteobacteria bacterium]
MNSIHASCVAFGAVGVLLRGASGSGKSSLCLRLIDSEGFGLGTAPLRARLVADDQVLLRREGNAIVATAPAALAGKLEIRGLGIVDVGHLQQAALGLVVDLSAGAAIERLPLAQDLQTEILGLRLPRLLLDGQAPDAAARLRAALAHFGTSGHR